MDGCSAAEVSYVLARAARLPPTERREVYRTIAVALRHRLDEPLEAGHSAARSDQVQLAQALAVLLDIAVDKTRPRARAEAMRRLQAVRDANHAVVGETFTAHSFLEWFLGV